MTDPARFRVLIATTPSETGGGYAVIVVDGGLEIAEITGTTDADTALALEFEAAAQGLSRLPSGSQVELVHFSPGLELTLARMGNGTDSPDDWSADLRESFDFFMDEVLARNVRIARDDPHLVIQGERLLRLASSAVIS